MKSPRNENRGDFYRSGEEPTPTPERVSKGRGMIPESAQKLSPARPDNGGGWSRKEGGMVPLSGQTAMLGGKPE